MNSFHPRVLSLVALVSAACGARSPAPTRAAALAPVGAGQLRRVQDFDGISDPTARSQALFLEASRVMLHPRCANCHPDGDVPLQGMDMRPHEPAVTRGAEDRGVVGMECGGCHQDHNLDLARIPGAPKWHVAPREMAWVGKTPHQICEQIKDPKRNGGRSLAQIVEHNAHDELVGWGWAPGHDREPAPGTQAQFGAIVAAWADTGAACPGEGARP